MKQPQIIINAADFTPEQLSHWIVKMADYAKKSDLDYEITSMKLSNAERALLDVASALECRISYLTSDQIIHSADHSSAIQEELDTLQVLLASVRDSQRTISSLFPLFQKISHRLPVRERKGGHAEHAEPEQVEAKEG
ncbi:hypothetical protein ABCJ02_003881 [Salmonella enterica]|nr:hypothetical protein [Salmonella enterica]EKO4097350.1 hypothetical protein [Salmonella enterica]